MHQQRFDQVIAAMKAGGLTQLIVAEDRALSYLTGHKANSMERVGALLIKDNGEAHSLMNKMLGFPNIDGIIAHEYKDGEDPYQMITDALSPGRVGFDDKWESKHTISILNRRNDLQPVLGSWAIDEARKVKDSDEQNRLKIAAQVNDRAITFGIEHIHPDTTELELADAIEDFFRQNGGINVGQYQVVCYGTNAADVHHDPGSTHVREGDAVLIDLVGLLNGYWCDMTRTVFYKSVSDENRQIYETVKRAQQAGIDAVKPGIPLKEIDRITRKVIEDAGYGEYFITRTGHGVGLSVHEAPMCSPDSEEICREGMCFSVEPGIYIPGKTGVRIEDLVIVTKDGCDVLTHYPKDLQIVG